MARNIKNFFVDKSQSIYIQDTLNVVYQYHDKKYIPLYDIFDNVVACASNTHYYFVITHTSIFFYNSDHIKIQKIDITNIDNPIISADYDCDNNLFVIACNNHDIKICKFVYRGNIYIKHYIASINYHKYKNFIHNIEKVKIVNHYIVLCGENYLHILKIGIFASEYVASPDFGDIVESIKPIFYQKCIGTYVIDQIAHINYFKVNHVKILLTNGIYLSNSNEILLYTNTHDEIFVKTQQNKLVFNYPSTKYKSHVLPILNAFQSPDINVTNVKELCIAEILFKNLNNFCLINNSNNQLIICNNIIILISTQVTILPTLCDNICLTISKAINKTASISIDINLNKPIVNQLINIIPNIYRLNSHLNYYFENTNDFNVLSYGEGVTRSVYAMLSKEIDNILSNNSTDYESYNAVSFGKLLYFCNVEGNQTFLKIHPYFYFCESMECDYYYLLKKFKYADHIVFYNNYLSYSTNEKMLIDLDLGLTSAKDYMNYLYTCDLTETQKKFYDGIITGYNFYNYRHNYGKFFSKLPITILFDKLINNNFFNANLQFINGNNFISKTQLTKYSNTFKTHFNKLSVSQKRNVLLAITGDAYYSKNVNIVFKPTKSLNNDYHDAIQLDNYLQNNDVGYTNDNIDHVNEIMQNIIHSNNNTNENLNNSNLLYDSDTNNNEFNENLDIVSNSTDSYDEFEESDLELESKSNSLDYDIVTCSSKIYIYFEPTNENITNFFNVLCVADNIMLD